MSARAAEAAADGRRARVARIAAALLLAVPAVLALASGGYFAEARLWAGLGACALALTAALVAPAALPRSRAGRLALAGLAGLLAWTLLSRGSAPVTGTANADAQRLALYLMALVAAAGLLRGAAARWAEPALAAGATAVVLYGLSERIVPGLVDLDDLPAATGRLAQPLTYWNAMGALAALGLVLAARLAGDRGRPAAVRMAAGAAAAPLGAGLALALSRGAIAATLIGLATLLALAPGREQARAAAAVAAAAALAGVVAVLLPDVRTLGGSQAQGLVLLAVLAAAGAGAALAVRRVASAAAGPGATTADAGPAGAPAPRPLAPGRLARRAPPARSTRTGGPRRCDGAGPRCSAARCAPSRSCSARPRSRATRAGSPAGAGRLASVGSNRFAYWRVALRGFAEAPVAGHGAGAFSVLWLRHRTVREGVRDAHSLELETAAELGVIGLLLLGAFLGGVGVGRGGGRPPPRHGRRRPVRGAGGVDRAQRDRLGLGAAGAHPDRPAVRRAAARGGRAYGRATSALMRRRASASAAASPAPPAASPTISQAWASSGSRRAAVRASARASS